MSSRDEFKARSLRRNQKRAARLLQKGPKTQTSDDGDYGDCIETMLPVPKHRTSKNILPKKKAKKVLDSAPKIESKAKKLQTVKKSKEDVQPDFSTFEPISKRFWVGEDGEAEPSEELKSLRKEIGVLVKGNIQCCPAPILSITSPSLPTVFATICSSQGISKPSSVQMQCWPSILYGADLLAIAPTGSGKTLAYCLPVIPHIQEQLAARKQLSLKRKISQTQRGRILSPTALILVPTRELAIQVVSVLKPLKRACGITSGAVYGGLDKKEQLQKLRAICGEDNHLDVLVATPGRLEDFLTDSNEENSSASSSSLVLEVSAVTYLVIDEADRMLTMGFMDQLNAISSCIRPDRQTLLFSATFPGRLREAAEVWVKDAVIVRCNAVEFKDHTKQPKKKNNDENKTPGVVSFESDEEKHDMDDAEDVAEDDIDDIEDERIAADKEVLSSQQNRKKTKLNNDGKTITDTSTTANMIVCTNPETNNSEDDDEVTSAASLQRNTAANAATTSSLTISPSVLQRIHVCASHKKPRLLLKYITMCRQQEKTDKIRQAGPMIIFCNKIKTLKYVHDFLKRQNIQADALHGQLAQSIREAILANFKSVSVIIASVHRANRLTCMEHFFMLLLGKNKYSRCYRCGCPRHPYQSTTICS